MTRATTADGLPIGYYHDDPEAPDLPTYTVCAEGETLRQIILDCLPLFVDPADPTLCVQLLATHDGDDELREWFCNPAHWVGLGCWLDANDDVGPLEGLARIALSQRAQDAAAACDASLEKWARTYERSSIPPDTLAALLREPEDPSWSVLCNDFHTAWMIGGPHGWLDLSRSRVLSIIGRAGERASYDGLLKRSGLPEVPYVEFDSVTEAGQLKLADAPHLALLSRWRYRHLLAGSPALLRREFTEFVEKLGARETTGTEDANVFDFVISDRNVAPLPDGLNPDIP